MIAFLFCALREINSHLEPFDTVHISHNLYDPHTDTAFIFDGDTSKYKDVQQIILIHTKDEAPDTNYLNYYVTDISAEEARNILSVAGYHLTSSGASSNTDPRATYEDAVKACNQKYEAAIIRYMTECDENTFPENGYEGLLIQNWFYLQQDGYMLEYIYKNWPCRLVLNDFAWGDWQRFYTAISKYMAVIGSSDIPSRVKFGNLDLGRWIGDQRTAYRERYLTQKRYNLLKEIGFSFNTYVDSWQANYDLLCEYKAEYGTVNISKSTIYKNRKLGLWCEQQRMHRTSSQRTLAAEQVQLLDALGFDWDPLETEWNRRFEQYKRYIKEHGGDPYIARRTIYENEKLGAWVETQRKRYKQGILSADREAKLTSIGVNYETKII